MKRNALKYLFFFSKLTGALSQYIRGKFTRLRAVKDSAEDMLVHLGVQRTNIVFFFK